jgi:hypothetical protein
VEAFLRTVSDFSDSLSQTYSQLSLLFSMISSSVENSPQHGSSIVSNRFASLANKWSHSFHQLLTSFHSCNIMLYHDYPTISAQTQQTLNNEDYWLMVESVHNLIGYSIEIWTQMSKIPLFHQNLLQSSANSSSNKEIHEIFFFFVSTILLEVSSFSIFNGRSFEKENIEEMNIFRVLVREFLRDLCYPNLFSYLLSVACHELKAYLESGDSSSTIGGLRVESALHAFSSLCRDKLRCAEHKQEIQKILMLWKSLLDDNCTDNRLICRISVSFFPEFIKFCLEKESLILSVGVISEEDLLSLFQRTFCCLFKTLSFHKEKFPKSQRLEFAHYLSFRLKQDHIGCVSFQKSCDILFHHLLKRFSGTTDNLSETLHFSTTVLISLFSYGDGEGDEDGVTLLPDVRPMLSTVIGHFRYSSSQCQVRSDCLFARVFIMIIQYLLKYKPSTTEVSDILPVCLPSFSIFFHAFCRLATFPFLPSASIISLQQRQQPYFKRNAYYWLLLSSSFIASLHLISPTMCCKNSTYQEMLNELSSLLCSKKILMVSTEETSVSNHDEFLSMILEFSQLLSSNLSLHIILSVIVEILHYLELALTDDITISSCLVKKLGTEASAVLPMDGGVYVEVLHFFRLFLSLLLSLLSNEPDKQTLEEYDLLDDIFDLLSTFSMKLISANEYLFTFQSTEQQLLCYQELLEIVTLFLSYCGKHGSMNIYKKKSIHSVFK